MSDLPTKILLATDGSASSDRAAHRATEMAHAFGAEVHVVHVMPVSQPYHLVGTDAEGPTMYEEDLQWAQELLDGQVSKIEEDGAHVTKAYLRTGEPDAEVVALAEDIGADMIIVGSRGMSRLRRPIGSVSSSIVAHAHCPVLVIRGQ
jgi:nucleotide-binding universal stress UspA family protein